MFYFLFILALVNGLSKEPVAVANKKKDPLQPIVVANKTAKTANFLDKVVADPKQFVAEVENLDPTALRTIITLLEDLLTTSQDREATLDGALADAGAALDSAAQAVADAEDVLTDKQGDVQDAKDHLAKTQSEADAAIGAASAALATAEQHQGTAQGVLDDKKEIHKGAKADKVEAENNRGAEIDSLNHEQEVIRQVIAILENLHADNTGASLTTDNWELVGGATLDSGVAKCESGGGCNIITKTEFSRPMEVSWTSRRLPSSGDECVVMDVFPQNNGRHSGYSIGYGWWAHYLGYGADNAQGYEGTTDGDISIDHVYKIKLTDTSVEFYQDDNKFATLDDTRYSSGKIRIGQSCVNWQVSDVTVKQL